MFILCMNVMNREKIYGFGEKKDMDITGPTTRNTRNDLMIVNMGPQNKK